MKSVLATTLGLVGLITALPSPSVDRVLPLNWKYTITSLRGPGCPDFGADPEAHRATRLTYGQNTVDGSEIYYWFVAYPSLRVDLSGATSSWCETELSYQEYKDTDAKEKADDYRLRLHKNGTRIVATYDLEDGVKANLKFTYDAGDDEITDTITLKGPLASGKYAQEAFSGASKNPKLYKLPKCGVGKIKFRTELSIEGKKGKKGYVASEHSEQQGKEEYYGLQQGFSYDFEKCGK